MLLASFISGIAGEPGKQMRYAAPCTVQEALRIALTGTGREIRKTPQGVLCRAGSKETISRSQRMSQWDRATRS
jgi:protein involved in polysaccharide export with SLBB domain